MVRVHVRPPPHPPSTPQRHSVRAVRLTDFNAGAFFHPPRRVSLATGRRPPILHRAAVGEDFFQRKQQTIRLTGRAFLCAALQDMPAAAPIPSLPRAVRSHGRPRIRRPDCTGAWRMPWRWQAKKDAASCDKPRGDACGLRSGGFRMGQPGILQDAAPA